MNKTIVRTIRIPESVDQSLKTKAADDGMTLNAEINSIIRQDLDWHGKMKEFGFAVLPRRLLKSIIEWLDDDTLAMIGREAMVPLMKDMAEWWLHDSSPEGILRYLGMRGRPYGDYITTVKREGDRCTIVHRHEYGPKWSLIIQAANREFVEKSFHAEPEITVGNSVVVSRFEVNRRYLSH
jgi:hypothetical protein